MASHAGMALAAPAEDSSSFLLDTPRNPVQALDFSADTPAGKSVRLSGYRGQLVLLNFWATWC
ncbi:MAG TPA: redoxin domain-containing protein, partial [bacterium]|nr:redoxin domain-containing protein [bacterium]